MFSKKVSIFVCSLISFMLITNLFAFDTYAESRVLDYQYYENNIDFDNPVRDISGGELIYIIAQQNGIKLSNPSSSDLYSLLADQYTNWQKYNPIYSIFNALKGTFYTIKNALDKTVLYVPKAVYNSILNFLRREVVVFGLNPTNDFVLTPIVSGEQLKYVQYSKAIFTGFSYFKGTISSYSLYGNIKLLKGNRLNTIDPPKDVRAVRYYTTGTVYQFNSYIDGRNSHHIFASLSPFSIYRETKYVNGNIETTLPVDVNTSYDSHGITFYYYRDYGQSKFYTYDNSMDVFSPRALHYSDLLEAIGYLFSIYKFNNTVININNYNSNVSIDSNTNVVINNVTVINNVVNITNNDGTNVPIDETTSDKELLSPSPPLYEPTAVTTTLNDIDTINNYHDNIDSNINDFLIQFNDNLNKIDTNCYSLTSCSLNGLKSVGNAVNDLTGYSDKGLNSDFVLLICLFLLLGILFTIL